MPEVEAGPWASGLSEEEQRRPGFPVLLGCFPQREGTEGRNVGGGRGRLAASRVAFHLPADMTQCRATDRSEFRNFEESRPKPEEEEVIPHAWGDENRGFTGGELLPTPRASPEAGEGEMAMMNGTLGRSLGIKAVRDLAAVTDRPPLAPLAALGGDDTIPCAVCAQQVAKYTCPRCLARYCTSACYREHGARCTEGFYKEQVCTPILVRSRSAACSLPQRTIPQNLFRSEARACLHQNRIRVQNSRGSSCHLPELASRRAIKRFCLRLA